MLYLALIGYIMFSPVSTYESCVQRLADRRGFEAISGAAAELLGDSIGVAELPIIAYMYTRTQDAPRSIFVTGMAVAFVVPQLVRIPPLIIIGLFGPRDLILGGGAATILSFRP